jgi:hypothetical protein
MTDRHRLSTRGLPVLSALEEATQRAVQEASGHVAPGHLIVGPYALPPFWTCATCGVSWSNGAHPPLRQPMLTGSADNRLPNWSEW